MLGAAPSPANDLEARLAAGQLALRQGRVSEAEGHLARAQEVAAELTTFRNYGFDAPITELAIAQGDSDRAITAALASIEDGGVTPTMAERLIPLAAQAAADEIQRLRDRRADPAAALARLEDLRRRYPAVIPDGETGPTYRLQVRAMQAWYDAEIERGRAGPSAAAWARAAKMCNMAGLPWDEAYCWWRSAEAGLKGRAERGAAATGLRRAYTLAVDLQASSLLASLEALARSARITPGAPAVASSPAPALPGLTPREREILALVAAGRTYSQIATELVVSEKTVSAHISNMLRKTGTSSRRELSQLVHRLTTEPGDTASPRSAGP